MQMRFFITLFLSFFGSLIICAQTTEKELVKAAVCIGY